MPQFFVPSSCITKDNVTITGLEMCHIYKVLRKKIGDELNIFDENGNAYKIKILDIKKKSIICKILETKKPEPTLSLTLYQCLPKSKKMDFIIEKMTELGVETIVPVISKYVVVKLDETNTFNKIDRWTRIAKAASKQSNNKRIPKIEPPVNFNSILQKKDTASFKLLAYEHGQCHLKNVLPDYSKGKPVKIIIGAEDGLHEDEVKAAEKNGWKTFRLKGNMLRAETAPITIVSVIKYALGYL